MKYIKFLSYAALMVLLLALIGCETDLAIENLNNPDTQRALATASDVEGLLGGSFKPLWFANTDYYGIPWSLSTAADEKSSSWGNSGMQDNSSEPRKAWDNASSYGYAVVTEGPWEDCYKAISSSSDALAQIPPYGEIAFIDEETGDDNTQRGVIWGKFVQGWSYLFLASVFDKAFLVDETTDLEAGGLETVDYMQVYQFGMQKIQECLTLCAQHDVEFPETWWPGNNYTNEDLAKICHSLIARFMAGVHRDEAGRNGADWATIREHCQQGITEDFGSDNDGQYWWSYLHGLFSSTGWTRCDYKCVGPADTSGAYADWLAASLEERYEFDIHTADARITGATPTDDGTYMENAGASPFRPDRGVYHFGKYNNIRYYSYYNGGYVGWAHIISNEEIELLQAEAELRLGNVGGAVEIINRTRVNNGNLPALTAGDDVGTYGDLRSPYTTIWAALKYEKGIETMQMQCGVAWMDRRGWGTLVPGTILYFPIPGSELEVLLMDFYTFGGVGQTGGAPKSALPMMDMPKL